MNSMNSVSLSGYVGGDPEVRFTTQGMAVMTFSLAIHQWSKRTNKTETEWCPIVVFDKRAENLGKILRKGTLVGVTGKLSIERWEKDGQPRTRAKVIASDIILMDRKPSDEESEEDQFGGVGAEPPSSELPEESDIPF